MKRDALLNSRLFSGLPPRALFRLCGCIGCTFVRSETGFVVSAQDGAAVLLEGLAAPRGGGIAGPGDSFPLFSGAAVPTSTGALLAVVSAEQAVGLCRNACPAHRSLARNMLALLADSCRAPDTPELRRDVAAVLLIYGGEGDSFRLPLTRSQLAACLGCPKGALVRELARLRDENIIDYEKRDFVLADIPALQQASGV